MGTDGSWSQAVGLKQNLEQNKNVGPVHCHFVALFTISLHCNTSQKNYKLQTPVREISVVHHVKRGFSLAGMKGGFLLAL